MRIRALLFAAVRERAGTGAVELDLSADATLRDARSALEERFPKCLGSAPIAMALNGEYVREIGRALREGDEIAFLPPVSGG